jgi:hypothetical protein
MVAGLERFSGNTLATELTSATPLNGIPHLRPILLLHHDMHEGVRIPEQELHQLALNLHGLIFEIRGREGVMGVCLRSQQGPRCDSQNNQVTLHIVVPPLSEPNSEGKS